MDYFIIFWVLSTVLFAMLKWWFWLGLDLLVGVVFFPATVMLYLMEGKEPAHMPQKETPVFDKIQEECSLVEASGISWQIARRLYKLLREQPPLEMGEYYAVFCGEDGVRVRRDDGKAVHLRYMTFAEGCGNIYCKIRSREAKRALAAILVKKASGLAGVYVDKPRRFGRDVMFTIISCEGFERTNKNGAEEA